MSEITGYRPSEALEVAKVDKSVQDLIVNGYDITDEARKDPINEINIEYKKPDSRASVLIARREGEAVVSSWEALGVTSILP